MNETYNFIRDLMFGRKPLHRENPTAGQSEWYYMTPKNPNDLDNSEFDFVDVPTQNPPNPLLGGNLANATATPFLPAASDLLKTGWQNQYTAQNTLTPTTAYQNDIFSNADNLQKGILNQAAFNQPFLRPDSNIPSIPVPQRKPYHDEEAFNALKQQIILAEKSVDYPYLDINGNLTYGIGHMDNSYTGFSSHPWINSETQLPATKGELVLTFDTIKNQKFGKDIPANNFEKLTKLRLPKLYIEELLDNDILSRHRELQKLPNYNQADSKIQTAMIEPHYTSNILGWQKLRKALLKKDKNNVCKELHRDETNRNDLIERNKWVKKQCMNGSFK